LSAEDALPTRRPGQLALCLAALAAGAGLAVAVASAGADEPTTASITAKDPYSFDNGSGGSSVSIARGGTVTFGYPTGTSAHSVVFDTAQPTSCTGMPSTASPPAWSGSCTFEAYGTYAFRCGLHSFMTGKVEVPDPNAPTTGTTGPTPTETTGPAPPSGGNPSGGELTPPAVKVAARQRGVVVRGSVTTPAGPSDISVTALVARSALASRARLVKVGALKRRSAGTGRTSFGLRVNRSARRALHHRHRFAVTLRIVVTPDAGTAFKKTVPVVLREQS
jgi:plastocyanin